MCLVPTTSFFLAIALDGCGTEAGESGGFMYRVCLTKFFYFLYIFIGVWVCLKRVARKTTQTTYQLKQSLLDDYGRQQLSNPSIIFKTA